MMPANAIAQPVEFSQMGPDKSGDVHLHRPYFLLPLAAGIEAPIGLSAADGGDLRRLSKEEYEARVRAAQEMAFDRIRNAVNAARLPFTDLYILSHGWHRNYYGAVSSYDRLSSRIATLLARGRLTVKEGYQPLFVCVQWSSEIGADGWVDRAGRRHKPSFLDNAAKYFDASVPDFQNTFEDLFELFSAMSAPDTDALAPKLLENSRKLAAKLEAQKLACPHPELQEHPNELQALKVAAAWTCYHEATAKGVLSEQTTTPRGFAKGGQRILIVAKFILGAMGAGALATFLFPKLGGWFSGIGKFITNLWRMIPDGVRGPVDDLWLQVGRFWIDTSKALTPAGLATLLILIGLIASLVWLNSIAKKAEKRRQTGEAQVDLGWIVAVPFLFAQIALAVPLLVTVLLAYIFPSKEIPHLLGLSREKSGGKRFAVLTLLSNIARVPGRIVARMSPANSSVAGLAEALESQIAFYSMQQRGVEAGEEAARVVNRLLTLDNLKPARVHFLGHSFGGVVVNNAAREIVTQDEFKTREKGIETLCTIEGAYASGWFAREAELVNRIDRTLASIYSAHDSATGFYYPLGNAGRFAAGSVGINGVQLKPKPDEAMLWAARPRDDRMEGVPRRYCLSNCTKPHIHRPLAFASLADPPGLPGTDKFAAINLDGSRMIYEGSIPSGGGHTDIYKDDVVYLMWAVAHRDDINKRWRTPPQEPEVAIQTNSNPEAR